MSDRTVAGLILLVPVVYAWWTAWGAYSTGYLYSAKVGRGIYRADAPKRFWAGVVFCFVVGCVPAALALLAFTR